MEKKGIESAMLSQKQIDQCQPGLTGLKNPVLPLVRLIMMLYLTSPHETMASLLAELDESIETRGVCYNNPAEILQDYLDILIIFERCKIPASAARIMLDENLHPLDQFDALDCWIAQEIVNRELETINSQLCGPCQCTLCCVGPDDSLSQDFFEIPLQDKEISFFALSQIDSQESRLTTSLTEPPFCPSADQPFYKKPSALYNWQNGWSMILPRNSSCPNLDLVSGGCKIYPQRPDVCRRPQIFSYVLERFLERDQEYEGRQLPAFVARKKLLAIWDCPYVRQFQEEIGGYAELCDLDAMFKKNKE